MMKPWLFTAVMIVLFGFGTLAAQGSAALHVSTTNLSFGSVDIGNVEYLTVHLDVTGSTGEYVQISGSALFGSSYFAINSEPPYPLTIMAMSSADIEIAFEPGESGPHNGDLMITEVGGTQHHVYLSGNGTIPITGPLIMASPVICDFGTSIPVFSGANMTFEVTRVAGATGTVVVQSADIMGSGAFYLSDEVLTSTGSPTTLPMSLDATGMAVFTVFFNPTDTDPQTGVVTIWDQNDNTITVDLYGTGAPAGAPAISVVPPTLDVTLYQDTNEYGSFQIHNIGTAPLNFDINTAFVPTFMYLDLYNGTVAPGDNTTINYTIMGYGLPLGLTTDQLGINSNDPVNPALWVPVNATVNAAPMVVDFEGSPQIAHPPQVVSFYDQTTYHYSDPTAAPNGWRWDFDNDGTIDSYLQNPTYTYTQAGSYSVRLTVISYTGMISECLKTDYIQMQNNAPYVSTGAFDEQEFMEDTVGGPFNLIGMFMDPDNDPLTLVFKGSAHISGYIGSYNDLYLNSAQDWYGTENIRITAWDPFGEAASHLISVTVLPVNDAPALTVPTDFYFIRNSDFIVDFSQYITDPDNAMGELSIQVVRTTPGSSITYMYMPVNTPNIPGQFHVKFSSLLQTPLQEGFQIIVNDNNRRAISTHQFTVHLIDHFEPSILLGDTYQFAGQTVQFNDGTLGNPDWWEWQFGDAETSTEQSPAHTYPLAGTYDIRLTLGNTQANEQATIFIPAMIHLTGTSVVDGEVPPVWTELGSPYNLYGDIEITADEIITIQPNVEINLFGEAPLVVTGVLNANLARFRSRNNSGFWGGLKFTGTNRFRDPSTLTDCDIVDALLPIEIDGQSPQISGVNISVTDTTQVVTGAGIKITGDAAPLLFDVEILNYTDGVVIDSEDNGNRTTPTLTNIRIRNSGESSRNVPEFSTGLTIYSAAELDDILIDNFNTGIVIDNQDRSRTTTPTLTNIRIRNSGESSRSTLEGMRIRGDSAPNIDNLDIQDVTNGLMLEDITSSNRTTPTLTNIRIRNSGESSRTEGYGLYLNNVSGVSIDTAEILGFESGIRIDTDTRTLSTPTLTNIRVRNSGESSRQENIGVDISGTVVASINDMIVEDYPYGIKYTGSPTRTLSTPTLTNIRVRNSGESSRQGSIGIQMHDLLNFVMENDSIGCFEVGLEIINETGTRELSTPTLTNIRVRNSGESSRYENVGIFLGGDVAGTLTGADVEDAKIGIFKADGNSTVLNPARIFNCGIGIKAAGSASQLPIKRHLIVVEPAFTQMHPEWVFKGMELNLPGPWNVHNNTIAGYYTTLEATNATVYFRSNISWSNGISFQPFNLMSSTVNASFNDMFTQQPYPGLGNINQDPLFLDPSARDFTIIYNSPCIDAGDPTLPADLDGTRNDIGAFRYLHRSSFTASARFIQTGTTVQFTNTSLGHDYPFSDAIWDLSADNQPEAFTRNWTYQFNTPGTYSVRLTMSTGQLVDVKTYEYFIVVQNQLLMPPQNVLISVQNSNVLLDWDPVEQTIHGLPVSVDFYLIYQSQQLDGLYDFAGFTLGSLTQYIHSLGANHDSNFYIILGFSGSRGELEDFIQTNRTYRPSIAAPVELRSKQ